MTTVLLTGAAGKVGKYVIGALSRRGATIVATDLISDGIPTQLCFERCDLTDGDAVNRMMARVRPEAVVHCAAVIAPISYPEPQLAEAVNLGGTRHLIDATKRHAPDAFFAFVSSYAAFGPTCPGDPLRTSADPCFPADNYGLQKLTAEHWLQSSGLRQCSLRLGAVMDMQDLIPKHWCYRPFMFMVPLDQPEHGVDVRDVARAIATAAIKQLDGQLFLIGGDDTWKVAARAQRQDVLGAMGLRLPHEAAFRHGMDEDSPDGWFYECWMDARHSQEVLGFQRTSRPAFMEELRKQYRLRRLALTPLGPLAARGMLTKSPYAGKGAISPGPTLMDDLGHVFGLRSAAVNTRAMATRPKDEAKGAGER
jgi:nucleoside-diphosphate-sugar epimerase